jgi:cell division septum initiation protein DivIVA
MSEITSAQMLDDIEKKIRKLLHRNERLEQENAELQKSIFEYIAQMDLQKKEMNQLANSVLLSDPVVCIHPSMRCYNVQRAAS